jgi:hypothetical protein
LQFNKAAATPNISTEIVEKLLFVMKLVTKDSTLDSFDESDKFDQA